MSTNICTRYSILSISCDTVAEWYMYVPTYLCEYGLIAWEIVLLQTRK